MFVVMWHAGTFPAVLWQNWLSFLASTNTAVLYWSLSLSRRSEGTQWPQWVLNKDLTTQAWMHGLKVRHCCVMIPLFIFPYCTHVYFVSDPWWGSCLLIISMPWQTFPDTWPLQCKITSRLKIHNQHLLSCNALKHTPVTIRWSYTEKIQSNPSLIL